MPLVRGVVALRLMKQSPLPPLLFSHFQSSLVRTLFQEPLICLRLLRSLLKSLSSLSLFSLSSCQPQTHRLFFWGARPTSQVSRFCPISCGALLLRLRPATELCFPPDKAAVFRHPAPDHTTARHAAAAAQALAASSPSTAAAAAAAGPGAGPHSSLNASTLAFFEAAAAAGEDPVQVTWWFL